jgi:hypothetical protein
MSGREYAIRPIVPDLVINVQPVAMGKRGFSATALLEM